MPFKITVDQEKCIGCGACSSVCDNFQMNDSKSSPVDSEVEEIGCNKDAEEGCPTKAITVEEI